MIHWWQLAHDIHPSSSKHHKKPVHCEIKAQINRTQFYKSTSEQCVLSKKSSHEGGTHNILQGQDHSKLSQALIQQWHIEFLRKEQDTFWQTALCCALHLEEQVLSVLEAGLPSNCGSTIIIQPTQRVTTVLLFHSYLSSHLPPPSSLVPFLSPWCPVPRYLGNAVVMFCSPFSRHSLALEGRCTLLVLLSSTPKKAHVDGSIKPQFNLHAAWDNCRKESMTAGIPNTKSSATRCSRSLYFLTRNTFVPLYQPQIALQRCQTVLWVGVEDISLIEEDGCHGNILNRCIG